MSRQPDPLFLRDKIYYARWYDRGKRILLSLGTPDRIEADRRLPIVRSARMSWDEYQRTVAGYRQHSVHTIAGLGPYAINPPVSVQGTQDGIKALQESALQNGKARFNKTTGEWTINTNLVPPESNNDLSGGLQEITRILQSTNDTEQIKQFYRQSVLQLYTDKKTASRFGEFWLNYLSSKGINSWIQITEKLCSDFRDWRKVTPQPRSNQAGSPPSTLVINRHLAYLSKSFELAVHSGYMKTNPIKFWIPESHQPAQKDGLTKKELKKVLNDPMWKQDYLMNGKDKIPLGYKLQDILLLLFTSCKRRGEIIGIDIADISFEDHYVSYLETKNSSKGKSYSIRKAFYTSDFIERLLRRVIGNRTEGPLFYVPDALKRSKESSDLGRINGDYLSELFKECVMKVSPKKDITLHCLRHTATAIMEEAGMIEQEIDDTLGHYNVKTALRFYQDRSVRSVALRLAGKTKKGVEVLSKAVE